MRCSAVVLAGILMGSLAVFVRNVGSNPVVVTFFRFAFGSVFLLPFVRDLKIVRFKPVLAVALVNLATVLCYIASIQTTEVATAALLLYMAPIYVTVYVWMRGEEVGRGSLAALPLAVIGLYLMLSPYGRLSYGITLGVLSGLFYAVLFILTKNVREFTSSVHLTFLSLSISTAILAPVVFVLFPGEVASVLSNDFVWAILLGLFPTALAFTLFNYGIKFCRTEKAPILALVEPVSAGFFGYVVFGEVLSFKQTIGAGLILLGVALAQCSDGKA